MLTCHQLPQPTAAQTTQYLLPSCREIACNTPSPHSPTLLLGAWRADDSGCPQRDPAPRDPGGNARAELRSVRLAHGCTDTQRRPGGTGGGEVDPTPGGTVQWPKSLVACHSSCLNVIAPLHPCPCAGQRHLPLLPGPLIVGRGRRSSQEQPIVNRSPMQGHPALTWALVHSCSSIVSPGDSWRQVFRRLVFQGLVSDTMPQLTCTVIVRFCVTAKLGLSRN